jgi:hypothetical protein
VPQFAGSVATLISQPSAGFVLQSKNPVLQTRPHDEAVHAAVAFAPEGHAMPHPPQFSGSLGKLDAAASQPSAAVVSQSKYPASQKSIAHAPLTQAGVAFGSEHEEAAPGSSMTPLQSLSIPSHRSGGSTTHGEAMMKNVIVSAPTTVVSVRADVLATRFAGAASPAALGAR